MKTKGILLIFLIVAAMIVSPQMAAALELNSIKGEFYNAIESASEFIKDTKNALASLKIEISMMDGDSGSKKTSSDIGSEENDQSPKNDRLVKTAMEILEGTGLGFSSIDGFAITPIEYQAPSNSNFKGFSKVGEYDLGNINASDEIINIVDLTKSLIGYIDTGHDPEIAYDRRSFRVDMKDAITEKDIRSMVSRNVYHIKDLNVGQGTYGASPVPKNMLAADTARAVEIESKEDSNADRFHFMYIFKTALEDVCIGAEFELGRTGSVPTRADLSTYLRDDGAHVLRRRSFVSATRTTVDDIMEKINVDSGLGVITFTVDTSKAGLEGNASLDSCLENFMKQFDFISPQMSSQPDTIKRHYPESLKDETVLSALDEGVLINMIKDLFAAYRVIDIIADDGAHIDVSAGDGRTWRISVTEISKDENVPREVAAR